MKIPLLLILQFLIVESLGQGFLTMDTLNAIPNEVKRLTDGSFKRGFRVDFNADGQKDYIVEMTPTTAEHSEGVEYWITNELVIIKKKSKYLQDHDFFWFINLDRDIEPEIFSATGYEDGIDYAIYDFDPSTGTEKLVTYLNPVISENDRIYWGYPWDISDMMVKSENKEVFLRASFDHDIVREGEITVTDNMKTFPAVFFLGHSTQPNMQVGQIRNVNWVLLESLR